MKRFARIYRVSFVVLMLVVVGAVFVVGSGMTSAVSSDVNFTLDNSETVLELTVPSTVNMYLSPTDGRDTGTAYLNIGVGTNNSTGYNLSMTASSTSLLRTSYVTTNEALTYRPTILPMGTTGSLNGYTESQFESSSSDEDTLNRWGYALASDGYYKPVTSGSIPISATVAPSNAVDPVYSPGPYNATVYFIAKVDASQPAGTYATTLNFTAVTNHTPITFDTAFAAAGKSKTNYNDASYYTMQDMTQGICYNVDSGSTTTLLDTRKGGTTYTIAKIGEDCVMTQNLSITGTIPAEGSNFSGSDITAAYASYSYLSSSYVRSKVAVPNATYGAYYNYCMATAGGVCVNSSASWTDAAASKDICPTRWRIPTKNMWSNMVYSGGNSLEARNNVAALFQAQKGGYLRSNSASPTSTSYGYYWSSTRYSNSYPDSFSAGSSGTSFNFYNSTSDYRYYGKTIRCMNAPEVTVTVSAGEGVYGDACTIIGSDTKGDDVCLNEGSSLIAREGDRVSFWFDHYYEAFKAGYGEPVIFNISGPGSVQNWGPEEGFKYWVGNVDTHITVSASKLNSVNVVAGTGVSSVSIDGGTAGATASGYYPEGKEITITVTPSSNSPAVYNWSLTGDGKLAAGYSSSAGSTFEKKFTVGSGDGNITVSLSENVTTAMQNFDSSLCSITGTYVYDNRDDEVYLVKKLADGKCWMLDNLRLDLTDSDVQANLTSSTTNASDTALGYLKNGGGSAPYAAEAVNSGSNLYTTPSASSYFSKGYGGMLDYGYGSGITGMQYNYCAASAGSYCYDELSGYVDGYSIQDDICPIGWKMPTNSEFDYLHSLYPSEEDFLVAYSVVMDYMDDEDREIHIPIWSSSLQDNYSAYVRSTYDLGDLFYSYGALRDSGHPVVRCVKDYRQVVTVNVTAGTGVSNVSINGGTAGVTATGTFREGSRIEITATPTSNSAHVYDWASTGGGTLESGLSASSGEAFTKTYIVGSTNGVITIDVSDETVYQMQNLSSSLCGTTGTYVYDNRDGEIYLVKKLADNNCWMLDNLRLDLTDSDVQANLTSSTTNAPDTALNYLKNGGGSAPYATTGVVDTTDINSINEPMINTDHVNIKPLHYGDGSGKTGVFYNICAASAGTYCSVIDMEEYPDYDGTISDDICPVGWRLPDGDPHYTNDEYDILLRAYNSNIFDTADALSISLSGYYSSRGFVPNEGSYLWSDKDEGWGMFGALVISYYDDELYDLFVDGQDGAYGVPLRCVLGS